MFKPKVGDVLFEEGHPDRYRVTTVTKTYVVVTRVGHAAKTRWALDGFDCKPRVLLDLGLSLEGEDVAER